MFATINTAMRAMSNASKTITSRRHQMIERTGNGIWTSSGDGYEQHDQNEQENSPRHRASLPLPASFRKSAI